MATPWIKLFVPAVLFVGCADPDPTNSDVDVEYPERSFGAHPSSWLPPPMHCDNLIPVELRKRYFPEARLVERPEMPSHVTCSFVPSHAKKRTTVEHPRVSFICRDDIVVPQNVEHAKELYRNVSGGRGVPGIGRLALAWDGTQVKLWDDDTNCSVDIVWPSGGQRVLAVASALADHLSSATLQQR